METRSKARLRRPRLKGLEKKLLARSLLEVGKRATGVVRRVLGSLILPPKVPRDLVRTSKGLRLLYRLACNTNH